MMKTLKVFILLTILMLGIVIVPVKAQADRASYWNNWSDESRVAYLIGYMNGSHKLFNAASDMIKEPVYQKYISVDRKIEILEGMLYEKDDLILGVEITVLYKESMYADKMPEELLFMLKKGLE